MRVGYIGNFRPSWSTENHVAGSLRLLGHEVVELQEDQQEPSTIAARVLDAGCDVLLYTKTWGLDPAVTIEQWHQLDVAGVPTVSYHLDLYVGLDREVQLDFEPFWRTRYVFSADGGHDEAFAAHGIDHEWLRAGVYGPECVSGRRDTRHGRVQVAFVGSHRVYHPEWPYRFELLSWLRSTYGTKFRAYPTSLRAIRGQQLNDLYATVPVFVGDSLCPGFTHPRYWSDRVYETLGRGGFLIHPYIDGMADEFVDGEHLRFYRFGDFDELRSIIDHYVAHPDEARAIAERGQQHVRDHCTYERRVAEMLDKLVDKGALRSHEHMTGAQLGRWSAVFEPRDDVAADIHGDDRAVISEVWQNNDYRLDINKGLTGTVLDVGANVGAFTVLAAKAGARRVVAVEPDAANRERLLYHVKLNRVDAVVDVCAAAVTDGRAAHVAMRGEGGGAYTIMADDGFGGLVNGAVPTLTLHELIESYVPVALLKVDIEGGEYQAFEALDVGMLASVERIIMEFHGPAMPHLTHLDDGLHVQRWGALVAKLADAGRVSTFGHPSRGGIIEWTRY